MSIPPAILLSLLAAVTAPGGPRQELSLNGDWQYQLVSELASPPAHGDWRPCQVPGYLRGHEYERAWLRRSFEVPAAMRGQRLKLCFEGVKYNSRVYVNGKRVGGHFGGYEPFELDVTDAVRHDGPNELAVGCHDWTGVFSPGDRVGFSRAKDWHDARGAPRDRVLAPIGGLYGMYGIWSDVTLRGHPAVYVKDLFIRPSVRRGELVVEYTLANESGQDAEVELRAAVEDPVGQVSNLPVAVGQVSNLPNGRPEGPSSTGPRDVLTLPPAKVKVPAGKTAAATLRRPWPDARQWSHVDPYLYHLRSELSAGDVLRTRFGFREFWTEGHRFFLNGAPLNLLATSWWPPHGPMAREEVRARWEAVKRCGCVAFRTHTQPWPSVHYDVADELGLLMIVEGAVWNDDYVYRIDDPVFWENYAAHLRAMVDRDKNRPSVVMWSLENEFYGGRLNNASPAKQDLVRMGRLVKEHDPTRPIFYESDGDPGGVADVVGIHYPHEYPDYTCWPDEAYWLRQPQRIGHGFFNGGREEFFWDKKKPLYVGEFLWVPSRDPSWHTVFFGDAAYKDYRGYRNLAKAEAWKMQIIGYRNQEVAGISPWTVVEGGPLDDTNPLYRAHQYAYQPVAAYCLDYDRRFFSGETVRRRVAVFNDVKEASELVLEWTLGREKGMRPVSPAAEAAREEVAPQQKWDASPLASGREALKLGPAERRVLEIALPMPKVAERTAVVWQVSVVRGGKTVFEERHDYWAFPPPDFSRIDPAGLALYDPKGATRAALASAGLKLAEVASLAEIPPAVRGLVIGAGAFGETAPPMPVIGRVAPQRAALMAFVGRGGRLLVLEQTAYAPGLFDVTLTDQQSTMTFPLGRHDALSGVLPEDLKFWRGESEKGPDPLDSRGLTPFRTTHLVTRREPLRPTAGHAVVVSGSAAGIDHAPLVELAAGGGLMIHCQMRLVEKIGTEPAAGMILANLLGRLQLPEGSAPRTALLTGPPQYGEYLRGLGLRFDDLRDKPDADLSGYGLVICRGEVPRPERLKDLVEEGRTLLVHRAAPDRLSALAKAFGLDLELRRFSGEIARAEGAHFLPGPFAREDLYWLGRHEGIDWADTPRATEMADGVFTKTLEGKEVRSFEVEDWKLEGGIVERRTPGVVFATNGSATAEIDFPYDDEAFEGRYVIGILARGTPCKGVYPVVRVEIDGQYFGTIGIEDGEWRTATTFGHVEKGRRKVSIAFVNDAGDPPREDRNLYVDKALIARDKDSSRTAFLTSPPAVAFVNCGAGRVILDQLRWDTEEQNARKAARYAGRLLTLLGADFTPRSGTAVECAAMTPQPGMPHFRNYGTHVGLACNGYVETAVEVAAAGRYEMELTAAGTPAEGVYPLVEVRLGGTKVGQVQLTSGNWRSYRIEVDLPEGKHDLALWFVNDFNREGEDRNVMLGRAVFCR